MAITIKTNKIGRSSYSSGYAGSFGIRQEINIKVQADGTISTSNLNLGNQGDDGVTLIRFDISGLVNKPNFFKNNDRYQPLIIHRYKGKATTFDFDGEEFFISSDITAGAGNDEYTENLPTKNEIFTSSIFRGEVKQTNYPHVIQPDVELKMDLAVETDQFFRKPAKQISYKGHMLDGAAHKNLLGYTLDKHTTFLELKETHPDLTYYMVYFTGYVEEMQDGVTQQVLKTIGVGFDENLRCWVPEEMTQVAGAKQLMVVGFDEIGSEYFSDVFVMTVEDNKITEEDFTPDLVQGASLEVVSDNGELMMLADENGEPILIEPRGGITTSYKLDYSGEEVEEVLDYAAKGDKDGSLWLSQEIDSIKTEVNNKANKASVQNDILTIF